MSNFVALTREKGSLDDYREAVWVRDYFGPQHYGVRFRGTIDFLDGDKYEIVDTTAVGF